MKSHRNYIDNFAVNSHVLSKVCKVIYISHFIVDLAKAGRHIKLGYIRDKWKWRYVTIYHKDTRVWY